MYRGTLLFTEEEYRVFMNGGKAIAYDPDVFEFDGREIVVNDFEIEQPLEGHRFLVAKKWG